MSNQSLPLTDQSQDILSRSIEEACRLHCTEPCGAHVLMSIPQDPLTLAKYILDDLGISIENLRDTIENIYHEHAVDLPSSDTIPMIVEKARSCVDVQIFPFVDTEHILLGILLLTGPVTRLAFEQLGVSLDTAVARTKEIIHNMKHLENKRTKTKKAKWFRILFSR